MPRTRAGRCASQGEDLAGDRDFRDLASAALGDPFVFGARGSAGGGGERASKATAKPQLVSDGEEVGKVVGRFADRYTSPSSGASTTNITFFRTNPNLLQFIDNEGQRGELLRGRVRDGLAPEQVGDGPALVRVGLVTLSRVRAARRSGSHHR